MVSYKRVITLIVVIAIMQLIFAITFAFYDLTIKKLEMQSMLVVIGELVEEDGYLDEDKLDIYSKNVLKSGKFDVGGKDELLVSISDSDLFDKNLKETEKPQAGQIIEIGIHLKTEPFKDMVPERFSKELEYTFDLPMRVIVQRWNKAQALLLDYNNGGYKKYVEETRITHHIKNGYKPSFEKLKKTYRRKLGD